MSHIDHTLAERGTRYGAFTGHAEITQGLKEVMYATDNWAGLADDQKEALDMVAHKIGRILNGDPNYIDSWHDIIGYTRLVEQRLIEEQAPKDANQAIKGSQPSVSSIKAELKRQIEATEGRSRREIWPDGSRIHVMFIDEESDET